MEAAQKFFLIPNDKIGRMEAIKQLESQPLLEHAQRLEQSKDSALVNNGQIPADQLLKYYADTLYKYQQFIENLKSEKVTTTEAKSPPPMTPLKKESKVKDEGFFSTPSAEKREEEEEEKLKTPPSHGSPQEAIIGKLPSGRKEKGKFFYKLLQEDSDLNVDQEGVVFYRDGRKVDTADNIVQNMARNLR